MIVRSSALTCSEVGHGRLELEFFRLGVHEFSLQSNCVLTYIRCVYYLNLCKKYTLIVSMSMVRLLICSDNFFCEGNFT